ncbi:isochorismatase family protein [Sphingomonas sp.]|uniref:isochorismatase family protein n=1 Tax=Sphingomonas sp. TaxID=28214 RepID=UPI001B1E8748|nr:isochorismatase family protein [Sphingomonas sp.]MBO9711679.1 isochorismatase family protein [Sphingomonas sp.]
MPLDQLDVRDTALIVIDMQNAFLSPEGTLGISGVDTDRLSSIVQPVDRLVQRCNDAGIPVIWTLQEHLPRDASRGRKKLAGHSSRRKQVSALAGSWDQEIIPELKALAERNPSYLVRKHRYGAFHQTRLDILLAQLGVRTLLIAGTTANACIETTLREAYLRDFDTIAVDDCISGVRDEWERVAREVWRQYLCETATSDEVLGWIDAQTAPRTLGFGHMLVMVEDMERSTRFYVDQLGFTIRPAKPLADGRPFTAFRQGIALVAGRRPGARQIDHMAFEVNDIHAIRERVAAAGTEIQDDLHDGPYGRTIYVTDPDGTRVELYEAEGR